MHKARIFTFLSALTLASTAYAGVIYSNDFDSANSLDGFYIGEMGNSQVSLQSGQVAITSGTGGYLERAFIALDIRSLINGYDPLLGNNDEISWSFNLSNVDGRSNNSFDFGLYNGNDPSGSQNYGYLFSGGGYVGNRMFFSEHALALSPYGPVFNTIVDEADGLAPGDKGAFKISYRAADSLWRVYFESSNEYINPLMINTLLGEGTSALFTLDQLPYIVVNSQSTGTVYLDNLTVEVANVPVPPASWLFISSLLVLIGFSRRHG